MTRSIVRNAAMFVILCLPSWSRTPALGGVSFWRSRKIPTSAAALVLFRRCFTLPSMKKTGVELAYLVHPRGMKVHCTLRFSLVHQRPRSTTQRHG